jgi:hypothetical protein
MRKSAKQFNTKLLHSHRKASVIIDESLLFGFLLLANGHVILLVVSSFSAETFSRKSCNALIMDTKASDLGDDSNTTTINPNPKLLFWTNEYDLPCASFFNFLSDTFKDAQGTSFGRPQ